MPNIHRFKNCFTGRLWNKPYLIWLLKIPQQLKYVTTVPSNLMPSVLYAVGWAVGRAPGLQKLECGVLAWLSVWREVRRLAYGPADATATRCLLLQ